MHICLGKIWPGLMTGVIIQLLSEKCCWHPPGPGHTYQQVALRPTGVRRAPGAKRDLWAAEVLRPLLGKSWGMRRRLLASPHETWSLPTRSASSFAISSPRHLPPGRLYYLHILNHALKTAPHLHTHPCPKQLSPPRHLHFILQVSVWRSYLEVPLLCVSRMDLSQSTHHSVVIADFSVFLTILSVPLELTKKVFSPRIPKVKQAFSLHIPRALNSEPTA